jgi:hypothetical protein
MTQETEKAHAPFQKLKKKVLAAAAERKKAAEKKRRGGLPVRPVLALGRAPR